MKPGSGTNWLAKMIEGSTVLGWVALASAALAAGTLVYTRFRSDFEDRQTRLATEITATLGLVVTLGPLPRLFQIESFALKWTFTAIDFVLLVFLIVQIRQLYKLGPRQPEKMPPVLLDK